MISDNPIKSSNVNLRVIKKRKLTNNTNFTDTQGIWNNLKRLFEKFKTKKQINAQDMDNSFLVLKI